MNAKYLSIIGLGIFVVGALLLAVFVVAEVTCVIPEGCYLEPAPAVLSALALMAIGTIAIVRAAGVGGPRRFS